MITRVYRTTIPDHIRYNLLERNQNFLAVYTGPTGSGKSYSCIRMAERIDPTFTWKRIYFTPRDFLKAVAHKKIKTGQAVILEEAGVGLNRREWYAFMNKALQKVLQTIRFKNYAILLNLPDLTYLDKSLLPLFHFKNQCIDIDHERQLGVSSPFFLIYSYAEDKMIPARPIKLTGKGPVKIKRVYYHKPSPEILEKYEQMKLYWTDMLYKELEELAGAYAGEQESDLYARVKTAVLTSPTAYARWRKEKYVINRSYLQAKYNMPAKLAKIIASELEEDPEVKQALDELTRQRQETLQKKKRKEEVAKAMEEIAEAGPMDDAEVLKRLWE